MKQHIRQNPSEGEVWLKAWCATASAANCNASSQATGWADTCLAEFRKRFPVTIHISGPVPEEITRAIVEIRGKDSPK